MPTFGYGLNSKSLGVMAAAIHRMLHLKRGQESDDTCQQS